MDVLFTAFDTGDDIGWQLVINFMWRTNFRLATLIASRALSRILIMHINLVSCVLLVTWSLCFDFHLQTLVWTDASILAFLLFGMRASVKGCWLTMLTSGLYLEAFSIIWDIWCICWLMRNHPCVMLIVHNGYTMSRGCQSSVMKLARIYHVIRLSILRKSLDFAVLGKVKLSDCV